MILFAITALVALSGMNYRLSHSTCYPPFLFSAWWCLLLVGVWLCEGDFGALSLHSIILFVCGAVAFAAGGLTAIALHSNAPGLKASRIGMLAMQRSAVKYILLAGAALLLVAWPFYWQYLGSLAASFRSRDFWWAMRAGTIAQSEMAGVKTVSAFIYDNLAILAIFLALTAVTHQGGDGIRKRHVLILVGIAVVYNLATASRSGAVMTIVAAVGIIALKRRAVKASHLVVGVPSFALVYSSMALLLKKGGDAELGLLDNVRSLWHSGLLYAVGPLVAFSNYVTEPSLVAATWSPSRAILQVLDRLGADVGTIPSLHTGYTSVGSNSLMNVYTMYFSYYPEYGDVGVIVCTALVGFCATWVYLKARERRGYELIYGMIFFEISMSGFNEGFLLGLNMWLKALVYTYVVYRLIPAAARRWRQLGQPRVPATVLPVPRGFRAARGASPWPVGRL